MCERELETEQNCNILTPTLMAISVVSFSFSRAAQPEAQGPGPGSLLDAGFLYRILSPTGLVSKLVSKLTDFLSSPSYIIVQSPTQYLPMTGRPWNGMFDRHQAEITVMQFTGHSLPMHQSVSVRRDFTLSHFVSQARPRQWNMHFRRLWNGMFGRVNLKLNMWGHLTRRRV